MIAMLVNSTKYFNRLRISAGRKSAYVFSATIGGLAAEAKLDSVPAILTFTNSLWKLCSGLAVRKTPRVDVLHALRQRHFKPAFAAILSAEHLAIARRDVDLLGVAVMQTDRHQSAVRRHPVEALPSLTDVLAAVERAVFR